MLESDTTGEAQWAVDGFMEQHRDKLDDLVVATRAEVADALVVFARTLQMFTRAEESTQIHSLVLAAADQLSDALNQARNLGEQATRRRIEEFEVGYHRELGGVLDTWRSAGRRCDHCPECGSRD